MRSLFALATLIAVATAACAGGDGKVRIPGDGVPTSEETEQPGAPQTQQQPTGSPDAGAADAHASSDATSSDSSATDAGADVVIDAARDATIQNGCFDVALGRLREIVKPTAGDLTISEWMADPTFVNDAAGEWIELRATNDVDLNGLQIGNASLGFPIVTANCVRVRAGSFVVFSRSTDPQLNGLGSVSVAGALFAYLPNASGTLSIGIDDVTLDKVSWTGAVGGVSQMIDGDSAQCDTPSWVAPYNDTDIGTPGAANGDCP